MRPIMLAAVLILTIGAVMPVAADARAPREVERWGCTFVAEGVSTWDTVDPNRRWPVYGMGQWECPAGGRRLSVTLSVFQDILGGPDLLLRRSRMTGWFPRYEYQQMSTDVIWCRPGAPPPANPYFLRMKVKRVGKPGAIALASRNIANPCAPWGGPKL